MEDLKLRAWHIPTGRMLYFDRLWLCTEYNSIAFELAEASRQEEYKLWAGHSHLPSNERAEYIFMLYTGRKDKNGKEIYDGDIVTHKHGQGQVFSRLGCWFIEGYKELGYTIQDIIEVIGNIWENPELKGGQ